MMGHPEDKRWKLLTIIEYHGKHLEFRAGDNNPEFKELFASVDNKVKQEEQDCCRDSESAGKFEQIADVLMGRGLGNP